jgi:hypothetical protein
MPPIPILEAPFQHYPPIYAWVFQVISFFQVSPPNPAWTHPYEFALETAKYVFNKKDSILITLHINNFSYVSFSQYVSVKQNHNTVHHVPPASRCLQKDGGKSGQFAFLFAFFISRDYFIFVFRTYGCISNCSKLTKESQNNIYIYIFFCEYTNGTGIFLWNIRGTDSHDS